MANLPYYEVFELTRDIAKFKEGTQLIRIGTLDETQVAYLQGFGLRPPEEIDNLIVNQAVTRIAYKGSDTPISRCHEDIINFYIDQCKDPLSYLLPQDVTEVSNEFGQEILPAILESASITINSIANHLKQQSFTPIVVGKLWYDLQESFKRHDNPYLIPYIAKELAKPVGGEFNTLEISIEGYILFFTVVNRHSNVLVLELSKFTLP